VQLAGPFMPPAPVLPGGFAGIISNPACVNVFASPPPPPVDVPPVLHVQVRAAPSARSVAAFPVSDWFGIPVAPIAPSTPSAPAAATKVTRVKSTVLLETRTATLFGIVAVPLTDENLMS
jgi:hypothetical protein